MLEHAQKTYIVTGANTGVGYETAKALANLGGRVIMTARNKDKGEAALQSLREETGSDKVALQMLDLGDFRSIQEAAEQLEGEDRIDVLINNAGLGSSKAGRSQKTKSGFELVMGTNHLGTFAFTDAMLPAIKRTARAHGEARIVNVSSMAHQFAAKFDPEDLFPAKRNMARDPYCESKLANLLHARELARRYGGVGIRAHAVHPGFVNSDFGRAEHFPGAWQLVFALTKPFQISPEKGAKTSLAAAISDDGAWNNGLYWDKEKPATPKLPPRADKVAKALWDTTERLLLANGFPLSKSQASSPEQSASQPKPGFPKSL